MKKGVKKALQWSVTAIILIVSIYYATKGIDYTTLWQVLKTADYEWVLIPIPIMLLSHWLRAMRWRTMLKPIFEPGSLWNMFSAVMIGYAMNNVIPRGGEFLRPYVYAKREKKSFSSVFATIVVERFI
ncbi:MAG: lysylphosphatidylglycerol synthase transmembrane domain-containing protein, partial [Bacteroidota bacterium]